MLGRLLNLGLLGFLAAKAYPKAYGQVKDKLAAKAASATGDGVGDLTRIRKHMEVVGSDGMHVGTVDHVAIRMTRTDPSADGRHHVLDAEAVASVRSDSVVLNMTAAEAKMQQKSIDS